MSIEPSMILLGLLVLLIVFIIGIYNSLVTKRNKVKEAFASIDVQLKKRYDLIPNILTIANQIYGAWKRFDGKHYSFKISSS